MLIYPKAIALWLVQNTSLSIRQIADFCQINELVVRSYYDKPPVHIKAFSPIECDILTLEHINECENDDCKPLNANWSHQKNTTPYMPKSKAKYIPHAIQWVLQHIPGIKRTDIATLLKIKEKDISKHKQSNVGVENPVIRGFCSQLELNALVLKYT